MRPARSIPAAEPKPRTLPDTAALEGVVLAPEELAEPVLEPETDPEPLLAGTVLVVPKPEEVVVVVAVLSETETLTLVVPVPVTLPDDDAAEEEVLETEEETAGEMLNCGVSERTSLMSLIVVAWRVYPEVAGTEPTLRVRELSDAGTLLARASWLWNSSKLTR